MFLKHKKMFPSYRVSSPGARHGYARSRVCQMDEYSFRLRWYGSLPLWTITSVSLEQIFLWAHMYGRRRRLAGF